VQPLFLPKGMGNIRIKYLSIISEFDEVSEIYDAFKSDTRDEERYLTPLLENLIK